MLCLGIIYQEKSAAKLPLENNISKLAINQPVEAKKVYNICIDTFNTKTKIIQKNQFLAEILTNYNVKYSTILELEKKSKDIFDIRRIKRGNNYTIFQPKNNLNSISYFVYEEDPIHYIVYDLRDSVKIYREAKPVEINERHVSGIINSSLYLTLSEVGANPNLAVSLADVFAWTIDFYRINAGDRFKVIYEEKTVDNKVVGIGTIKAAVFTHLNQDFYAFLFNQGGESTYFDSEGHSLRKQFLKNPLNYTRISSRYTNRRYHPVQKRFKAHLGTDYAAPTGTPIKSVGDGVVIAASYTAGNGRYVKIKHNSVYTTQYLHMSKIASGIKKGQYVKQGQVIGFVGSTGLATGPHLCYRFWKNGKQIDPFTVKLPPSEPINKDYEAEFHQVKSKFMLLLENIAYIDDVVEPVAHYGY
jgi:murein DD-endopeptidase MepM/ murein hydrolase activator NlpD